MVGVSQSPPDDTRGPLILGLGWTTMLLACLVAGMRMRVRLIKKAHGWDDYVIYVALIFVILCAIINILQVKNGFGRHVIYVLPTLDNVVMWITFTELFSTIGVCLVKVSVCLFVLRFIGSTHRPLRILLWMLITVMSAITIALSVVLLLQCQPLAKVWNPNLPGTCWSSGVQTQLSRTTAAFGTATDLICVIIPLSILCNLKIEKKNKIALIIIIGLGFMTAGFATAKTVLIQLSSDDFTWDLLPVFLLTMFELNFGFIVACLPALHPVLVFIRNQANQVIRRSPPATRHYFRETGLIDSDRGMAVVDVEGPKEASDNLDLDTMSTSDPKFIRVERNTTVEVEYEDLSFHRSQS